MPEERGWLDDSWAFTKSLGSGVLDAGAGLFEGVGELVKGGYALATDEKARESAWKTTKKLAEAVEDYGEEVWDDPAKAYRDARDGTLAAYNSFEQAKEKAAVEGRSAEFWGNLTGKGVFEVGTILLGVGVAAKAGKVASAGWRRVKEVVVKGAGVVASAAQRAKTVVVVQAIKAKDWVVSPVTKCPLKKDAKAANTDQDMIDNLVNQRRKTGASGDATFAQGRDGNGNLTDIKESSVQSDGSVIHAEIQVLEALETAPGPTSIAVDQTPCSNCTQDIKKAGISKVIVTSTPGNPAGSPKTAARKAAEKGKKVEPRIIKFD